MKLFCMSKSGLPNNDWEELNQPGRLSYGHDVAPADITDVLTGGPIAVAKKRIG
jgi:hypothetical protein